MGGYASVQIRGGSDGDVDRAVAMFGEAERALSRFSPDSELCRLNAAGGAPFVASPLLYDAVTQATAWARSTHGIFDPTVLDALERAGYDRTFDAVTARGAAPAASPLAGAWRGISLDASRREVTLPRGVRIDLGGIGKGFTVDRAARALGTGADALVVASGDIYASGGGPDGDGWLVGVQHPSRPDEDIALLSVRDRGVATSGRVRRRWTAGGREMHHIIDPRTGTSAEGRLLTVTVVAASATEADVLAKTAFVLGLDGAAAALEQHGAAGIAVTRDGATVLLGRLEEYLA